MSKRRLNPLAFPAETSGRFTILIISAVALTWLVSFAFLPILAGLMGIEIPFGNALQAMADVSGTVSTDVYIQDLPPETLAAYY